MRDKAHDIVSTSGLVALLIAAGVMTNVIVLNKHANEPDIASVYVAVETR